MGKKENCKSLTGDKGSLRCVLVYLTINVNDFTGYMVEITTGFRRRSVYEHSHPLRNDSKIKLVGEDGETGEERLIPRGGGRR